MLFGPAPVHVVLGIALCRMDFKIQFKVLTCVHSYCMHECHRWIRSKTFAILVMIHD